MAPEVRHSSVVSRATVARHIRRSRRLALSALTHPIPFTGSYLRSRAPHIIVRVGLRDIAGVFLATAQKRESTSTRLPRYPSGGHAQGFNFATLREPQD